MSEQTSRRAALVAAVLLFGCRSTHSDLLIAGGEPVPAHEAHASASVALMSTGSPPQPFCSGVLLRRDLVLTAAHCIDGAEVTVGLGPDMSTPRQLIKGRAVRHESYGAPYNEAFSFDLALVLLAQPVPSETRLVPLGTAQDLRPGGHLTLTGFGVTSPAAATTTPPDNARLLQVEVTLARVYDPDDEDVSEYGLIVSRAARREAGACSGDSGGPVFAHTPAGMRLVAITVGGMGPCNQEGFHTSIPFYRDWIDQAERQLRQQRN
jgi:secreted trypsin-like serine protease